MLNYIYFLNIIFVGKIVTSLSCNDGYFLDSNSACVQCPDHCQFCESKAHCLSCENGYWGNVCEKVCSSCKNRTSCEKSNGFCLEDCKNGFTGALCDAKCSDKCLSCSRTDAQICSSCAVGRYPLFSCSKACPSSCYNKKCNSTGFCTLGCANGTWGQKCEERCSEFCKDSICFRENGTCTFGCKDRYTGINCDTVENWEEFNTTVVIVLPIIATLIILALVVTLFLWIARKGTCTRAWLQKTFTRRFRRRDSNTENPDEIEELNQETTEKSKNDVSKAHTFEMKSEADEQMENTATRSEANLRQRAADKIFRCKTLVCCVSDRCDQTPEEFPTETYNETELNAPEEKKTTRKERLEELVESIQNKTDEDYKKEFSQLPVLMQKSHATSQKEENRSDIEKEGVFPYDENRVIVRDKKGKELYVNASHIKDMDDKTDAYIACAGPKNDDGRKRMWKLLPEYDCKTVVMLSAKEEKTEGIYWPELSKSKSYDRISVKYVSRAVIDETCIARLFSFEELVHAPSMHNSRCDLQATNKGSQSKFVKQLQFIDWPETGVPRNVKSLVTFLDTVKLAHLEGSGPLVVHGRYGVGSTGTFIALHMLSKEVEDILSRDDIIEIDIYSCVEKLRKQRVHMVANLNQYKFLHEALSCYIVKRLESKREQQQEDKEAVEEKTKKEP